MHVEMFWQTHQIAEETIVICAEITFKQPQALTWLMQWICWKFFFLYVEMCQWSATSFSSWKSSQDSGGAASSFAIPTPGDRWCISCDAWLAVSQIFYQMKLERNASGDRGISIGLGIDSTTTIIICRLPKWQQWFIVINKTWLWT